MSMTFPFPSQKIYRHWNHKGAQETTRPDRAASTSWSRCLHFLFFMFSRNGKSPMAVYFWVQLSFLSWNFLLWRNQFPKLRDIVSKRLFLVIIFKHMVWMMKGKKNQIFDMCAKQNISLEGFPNDQASDQTVEGPMSKHRGLQNSESFAILWMPKYYASHQWRLTVILT